MFASELEFGVTDGAGSFLYDSTGKEYLDFVADVYGVLPAEKKARIERYLQALGLEGREGDIINSYSQGMKQKIALISALIHKPTVLILDEPLNGRDP